MYLLFQHEMREKEDGRLEYMLRGRGFDLLDEGEPEAALAVFAINLRIHPDSPRARQAMGEAHLETGHPDQAIPYLEHVLQHDPDNSFVLHTLERLRK